MTIKRAINGEEFAFELTKDELFNAYLEQEFIFDKENVAGYLESLGSDWTEDNYGLSLDEAMQYVDDIASELRRNIDKYEMGFDYAIDEALKFVLSKKKR